MSELNDYGKVSVIIPSYESKWCIAEAIDSVMNQTYKNFEIIVVDDGSTDGTYDFLKEKYSDSIYIIRQSNQGLAGARNTGLSNVRGQFIQFLDADDIILPNKFEIQLKKLSETGSDVITSSFIELNEKGVYSEKKDNCSVHFDSKKIITENIFGPIHNPLIKKSVVDKVGNFNLDLHNYCADWEFWLRVVYIGITVSYVDDILCVYRRHSNSLTKSNKYANTIGDINVIRIANDLNSKVNLFSKKDIANSLANKNYKALLLLEKRQIKKRMMHIFKVLRNGKGVVRYKLFLKSVINLVK